MRCILYTFGSFEELAGLLEEGEEHQDLKMPSAGGELADGDWVLVTVEIGGESTSVAANVCDLGVERRLAFEERDWHTLQRFAAIKGPPSVPPSAGVSSENVAAPPNTKILVIDDDVETQGVLRALLERAGYSVRCVDSAEAAFDLLREVMVHMVVFDRSLPGMDGLEFCRRARRDSQISRLPLLCLSADSSSEDLVAAFDAGADDYVAKPFRQAELSARVIGLLRRARMAANSAV